MVGHSRRAKLAYRLAAMPVAALLGASLWLLGPAAAVEAAPARPGPGAPRSGDSLFPDVGNGGYNVTHYGIKLTYQRDGGTITATTTIKARALKPLTSYTLDLEGLTVRSVAVNGHHA